MVGVRGFEPPAPCSQSRCATRLRHTPMLSEILSFSSLRSFRGRQVLMLHVAISEPLEIRAFFAGIRGANGGQNIL
jgi:hypothetical protein